jgi:putative nucleotidyltransferase with HDIG domain
LVKVLSLDQTMTGTFLRMVNSAYYALPRRITSLDEAVGFLGYNTVRQTILSLSVGDLLSQPLPSYGMGRTQLWRHSVAVASGSDWIARERDIPSYSEAYVAGLLHDVGKLALDIMLGDQVLDRQILQEEADMETSDEEADDEESESWIETERRIAGYHHAQLSAVIVRSWNLTDRVVEAIASHHTPDEALIDQRLSSAVHIANKAAHAARLAEQAEAQGRTVSPKIRLDPIACEALDWDGSLNEGLVWNIRKSIVQAEEAIGMANG